MNYYNENDPFAAAWLRELIEAGVISRGEVDTRSITEVTGADVDGFTQCHFFAGIGGWSYALRLAGWPDNKPVWTGSCPCQPFSSAGQRKVDKDERHLWPAFRALISERTPTIIFGEQVASADGRIWLAGIRADLEAMGNVFGAADLCAAGVGAPHPRQRLYWMAYAKSQQTRNAGLSRESAEPERLADPDSSEQNERASGRQQQICDKRNDSHERMGNSETARLQGQWSEYRPSGERCSGLTGLAMQTGVPQWNGPTVAVECLDGPRRVSSQPDAFPLAHGVSARMGKLRGSGNAIVPELAAQFIRASIEAIRLAAK